jgi:DNA excision repair protein ERCC-4
MASQGEGFVPLMVLADYREAASPVPSALEQMPCIQLAFKHLPVGDYEVDRRCVFERKTLSDFAASIADGRLFIQAQRLAQLNLPTAILLEGGTGDLAKIGMSRECLQGAMISLSLVYHLPVLRALDPAETARLLVYAGYQLRRHECGPGCRYGKRPKRKRRLQLHILQGLPGIGPTRAELLLKSFGSVEAVMTASLECLEAVEGLGKKRAEAIRQVLGEAAPAYRISDRHQAGTGCAMKF